MLAKVDMQIAIVVRATNSPQVGEQIFSKTPGSYTFVQHPGTAVGGFERATDC